VKQGATRARAFVDFLAYWFGKTTPVKTKHDSDRKNVSNEAVKISNPSEQRKEEYNRFRDSQFLSRFPDRVSPLTFRQAFNQNRQKKIFAATHKLWSAT
jgi:hypothetical protein